MNDCLVLVAGFSSNSVILNWDDSSVDLQLFSEVGIDFLLMETSINPSAGVIPAHQMNHLNHKN